MKKILLSVALLLCTIIPAYSMEVGKEEESSVPASAPSPAACSSSTVADWKPGESSAGILPFRLSKTGFRVLIIRGRDFGKDYTANRTYPHWSTLTGHSESTESSEETAIREGVEEMSFPLDKATAMIEAYRTDGKLRASQESISYQKLKAALANTKITPDYQAPGTSLEGTKYGSSFLYPVDVTEFANALIQEHARNDKEFFSEKEDLHNWCETAEMQWVDYKNIQTFTFRHPGVKLSVQGVIKSICNAHPSICPARSPQAFHGKSEKRPTEKDWRRSSSSGDSAQRW